MKKGQTQPDSISRQRESIAAVLSSIEKYEKLHPAAAELARSRTFGTGFASLDEAMGVGGYPRGMIVEVYGAESSSMTIVSLCAMREVQRGGGVAAIIDTEHAFDVASAVNIGLDTQRLLVCQTDTGAQALDIAEVLTRSGAVDMIVIDSLAAMVPKVDGEPGDSYVGLQSRTMSQALRSLATLAYKTWTTLLFVNRLRSGVDATPGSAALKLYASVRLDVRQVNADAGGSRTRVKVVKNKCAPPFKEALLDLGVSASIEHQGDGACDPETACDPCALAYGKLDMTDAADEEHRDAAAHAEAWQRIEARGVELSRAQGPHLADDIDF